MTHHSDNKPLIIAIILSALLVSAALIYAGYQYQRNSLSEQQVRAMLDESLPERIEEGIKAFIAQQRQAAREAQANQTQAESVNPEAIAPVSEEQDHIYGDPEAPLSIVEYSDFECPFCKRFHPVVKRLVDNYEGQVNWVYRHYPLPMHNPGAQTQAEASECVAEQGGNEAFWAFTNAIYERTSSGGRGFPRDQLAPLAAEIGVDRAEFSKCLSSGRYREAVLAERDQGARAGVTGTPGNILVHHPSGQARLVSGALPYEQIEAVVTDMLGES